MSRMWAPEESASAQRAARSHTDAVLQHGIKMTSSSSSSSETEAMQNVSKDFHGHICCLEREWDECDRAFSHTRVCVLLPCRVASGICKVSLTSAVVPTPLCRSLQTKDSVWIRQNIIHSRATVSALRCCAYLICLFFSVCLLRLSLRFKISSLKD